MSAETAIESLREVNPDALRLAESVSFAVMIDRAFLRAVRLSLTPPVDAGAEADLWFSALVQSRTADGIVVHPEAADALRRRLSRERVEEVWALTSREHAWLAPSLQLEERIAYLSVSRKPTAAEELADCLRSVLAAMVSGEREGLAAWAVRALAMFPSRIQALPEARMLDTGTRMRLGDRIAPTAPDQPFPSWVPWIAPPSLGTVSLDFELREGELEIRTSTEETPVRVPETRPLLLEVSWEDDERRRQTRQITFRPGETVVVPVSGRELVLRTITGETYDLRERGQAPAHLRDEIIDFSAEMQKHAEAVGREEEIESILLLSGRHQTIVITGEPGAGKTALLSQLVREAGRRQIDVFGHAFRFGDLRLESGASAERSIAAQIAVRFGLRFRDVERPLADVIDQLGRIEHPERMLIAIDDLDQARGPLRDRGEVAIQKMRLPSFIRVIATSTNADVAADSVYPLPPWTPGAEDLYVARSEAESIDGLAAAWRPLPTYVFVPLPDGLFRYEDESVEIHDSLVRQLVFDKLGREKCHRSLVRILEQNRRDERIDAYYLLNAPLHLIEAGDLEAAERLCTGIDFMIAKIRKYGVDALAADYSALADRGAMTIGSASFTALQQSAAAIEAAPQDIGAILYTTFLAQNVVDEAATAYGIPELRMLPEPLADVRRLEVLDPRKHDGPIRGCSSTDSRVVTWSDDGTARFWFEDRRGTPAVVLDHGAAITTADLDWPDFISGDARGFLRLWDFEKGREVVKVAAHDQAIDGLAVSDDGQLLVTWSGTEPIRLWRRQPGLVRSVVLHAELTGHADMVTGCSIVSGREMVVSASRDGTCQLWRVNDGALLDIQRLSAPATGMTRHWKPEPRIVLTGSRMIYVILPSEWELSALPVDTGHELPPRGVSHSDDGSYTATWSDDQTVRVWRFGLSGKPALILRGHRAAITACRFASPYDHSWLVSADADGVAIVWNRDTGEIVSRFHGHRRAIRAIGVGDGVEAGYIVTAGDDGIPLGWEADTGALISDFSQKPGRAASCVVLPGDEPAAVVSDGEYAITAGSRETIRITRPLFTASAKAAFVCAGDGSSAVSIDLASRFAVETDLPLTISEISAYAAHSVGRRAVGTNDGQLSLLHASQSWIPLDHADGRISALAFGAMPSLVSLSGDRILGVWNIESGRRVHRIEAHSSRVLALAVQEGVAITGSAAGTLRIWDLETGRATATLRHAHAGPVTGLWMAGNVLVSSSLDRTIRIFDHRLGQELAVCRGHTDTITGVAIALYEEAIFSCGEDRTIRRWNIATGTQQAVAYGTAPFRSIDWRDGTLIAGDDAGILWTVRSAPDRPAVTPNVYLLHSREDSELADRLREDLAHAVQFSELEEASTVIAIVSRALVDSTYGREDLTAALRLRKHIIPLLQAMNRSDLAVHMPELASYASFTDTAWSDEKRYAVFVQQLLDTLDEP